VQLANAWESKWPVAALVEQAVAAHAVRADVWASPLAFPVEGVEGTHAPLRHTNPSAQLASLSQALQRKGSGQAPQKRIDSSAHARIRITSSFPC
jgi:hypothetical protein